MALRQSIILMTLILSLLIIIQLTGFIFCNPDLYSFKQSSEKTITTIRSKLRQNGIIYISDYYLQDGSSEVKRYEYLNDDQGDFGIFTLPEGAIFRHHTKKWIAELVKDFKIIESLTIDVKTMNGNSAKIFQLIILKNSRHLVRYDYVSLNFT